MVSDGIFEQELAEFKANASLHGVKPKDIVVDKGETKGELSPYQEAVKLQSMGIKVVKLKKDKK